MKYTKTGVPVLTDVMIEAKAYSLLSRFDSKLLEEPVRIPIPLLLNYLKNDFNLEIIATSLGIRESHRILGKTVLSKNLICFDKDLIHNEILFNFTAAHEIGHWLLHRSQKIAIGDSGGTLEKTDDCEIDYWERERLKTQRDWIEHHANVFAGSLLMPRLTFRRSVEFVQDRMGIVRNRGKIFFDSQQSSEKDLDKMLLFLRDFWGTSKQSVLIRLKSLGILIEDVSRRAQHISEIPKGMSA
jgi:Zn-dependent peptidase ImmA (M78 family)